MNKGFTLIELLTVMIILGIITAIAVPVYINLQDRGNKNNYKYYKKVVDTASKLYIENYVDTLPNTWTCFSFPYKDLIDNNKIKEETYKCDGYITIRKITGTNFKVEQYLNCKDNKNKDIVSDKNKAPISTCRLNYKYF